MSPHHYIAIDLGAESGRVMLGRLESGRLAIEEIHRFANGPVRHEGTLRWDLPRLGGKSKPACDRWHRAAWTQPA